MTPIEPEKDREIVEYLPAAKVRSCLVCGMPLIEPGGCAGTGMCGPCCTGDASTAGEY